MAVFKKAVNPKYLACFWFNDIFIIYQHKLRTILNKRSSHFEVFFNGILSETQISI